MKQHSRLIFFIAFLLLPISYLLYTGTHMNQLTASLSLIFSRKDSRYVMICVTFAFLFLLLLVENGASALVILSFDALPIFRRLLLAFQTFFDITSTFTASTLILAVLGSCLGGINLSLAYTYMRLRGDVIVRSGLYSGLGLFVAFLGIGCAACGTALLSVIFGFFGFSAMLQILPYEGMEIGYIGLLILCLASYTLAKKVAAPNVC